MHKQFLLGLALCGALSISTTAIAIAQGDGAGGWHGHGGHHGAFMALSKLNLTDAQRASIKQIMKTSFAQGKTQRQAVRQARQTFAALTPNQAGYQDAANQLAQAEAAATQQRVLQQAQVRAQVYAVLTPQQQAELATMKAQAQARRQEWQQFKAAHAAGSTSNSGSN